MSIQLFFGNQQIDYWVICNVSVEIIVIHISLIYNNYKTAAGNIISVSEGTQMQDCSINISLSTLDVLF